MNALRTAGAAGARRGGLWAGAIAVYSGAAGRRLMSALAPMANAAKGRAGAAGGGAGGSNYRRRFSGGSGGGGGGFWAQYQEWLATRPMLTKSVTSLIITAIGDVLCQNIIEDGPFDWARFVQFSSLGLILVGPGLHFWYGTINRIFPGAGLAPTLKRLACDQLLWAPPFIALFLSTLKVVQGKPDEIAGSLKQNLWPSLIVNWQLWPLANFINFKFMAPQNQVLFANFVSLIWNTYLSYQSNLAVENAPAGGAEEGDKKEGDAGAKA